MNVYAYYGEAGASAFKAVSIRYGYQGASGKVIKRSWRGFFGRRGVRRRGGQGGGRCGSGEGRNFLHKWTAPNDEENQDSPAMVIPVGFFTRVAKGMLVLKITLKDQIPDGNAYVFLENKEKIGKIAGIYIKDHQAYATVLLDKNYTTSMFEIQQILYIDAIKTVPFDSYPSKPSSSEEKKDDEEEMAAEAETNVTAVAPVENGRKTEIFEK